MKKLIIFLFLFSCFFAKSQTATTTWNLPAYTGNPHGIRFWTDVSANQTRYFTYDLIEANMVGDSAFSSYAYVKHIKDSIFSVLAATYSPIGHTHTFGSLTSKPTTLGGYGITDGQSQLNGTGIVRMAGITVSYDNNSYLTGTYTYTPLQYHNSYGIFVTLKLDSIQGGTIIGTAGIGYFGFTSQSVRPTVPSGLGMREYVDSVGRRSYLGANNLSRSFDPGGQSANRVYKFQDRNYTFADSADVVLKLNITDTSNIRFRPHAGTNITLSGSYPDITFNSTSSSSFPTQQSDATTGTTVTVSNQTGNIWLIKNPATLVASYTITFPATPVDGQYLLMSFGGTITQGNNVITSISFNGNGKTILQSTTPSIVQAGESFKFYYSVTNTTWYRVL